MNLPIIEITSPDTYVKQPWKNGCGSTEQLLAVPDSENFDWRLSVATIEKASEFSQHEGYLRVIVPLTGQIVLKHDSGAAVKVAAFEAHRFNGSWRTECFLLAGATQDFNLIYRPQKITVQVGTINLQNTLKLRLNGDSDIIYCADGGVVVATEDESSFLDSPQHGLIRMRATAANQSVAVRPAKGAAAIIHLSIKNRQ